MAITDTRIIPGGPALYQSVQIIIDPKVRNLDKTMHDILEISALVAKKLPSARLISIAVNDYFATVRAMLPRQKVTIRLYEIKGTWKIRGSSFDVKERAGAKDRTVH